MKTKNTPLWTALVTPFDDAGKIHYPSLEKLARMQEAAGNGIVLFGSTGEGLALDDDEKREALRFVCSLKLSSPLMVGVGGFHLPSALRWLAFCEELPVDAYLFVTPLYAKPGAHGQTEWFRALLDRVRRPAMLYNVPSRAGVKLHPQALRALAGHENLWAVKEASGSVTEFQDLRAAAPNVEFYCGDDALLPFFASAGAVGLVSVAGNPWPKATKRYVERSVAGKHAGLLPTWRTAADALFTASNPVPAKALLHELGWIPSAHVRPPLSSGDLADREILLAAHRLIQDWEVSLG